MNPYLSRRRRFPLWLARLGCLLPSLALLVTAAAAIYRTPIVNDALFWRVELIKSRIRNQVNPHPENLATPMGGVVDDASINLALTAIPSSDPTATIDRVPTATGVR